jgi:CheY-like chemotaxis protein
MGFTANYFFKTSRVMAIIINSERTHTLDFQLGIEEFYQYLQSGDSSHLENCYKSIARANLMAKSFGNSEFYLKTKSDAEFSELLYNAVTEGLDFDRSNADLLVNRVKLLLWINNPELKTSLNIATQGAEKGEKIIEIIQDYVKSPSPAKLVSLNVAVADMHIFYKGFAASISAITAFANRLLIWGILLITILLAILTFLLSTYISKLITGSLHQLIGNFKEIVNGNVDVKIDVLSKDEVGLLSESFNEMQQGLKKIVEQTISVADGDYSSFLEPKSENDKLSLALNKMTKALDETSTQNQAQNWAKSGQNLLNEKMRGDLDLQTLSTQIVTFVAEYLHSQMGTLYLLENDEKTLRLYGSYAFIKRKRLNEEFRVGEGMVGQAAFGRQMISLTELPEDYTRITSSTGDMMPRNVVVQPLLYDNKLLGVIELASKEVLNDQKLDFLIAVSENIAISINSARSRQKVNDLLLQTQNQAEELRQQQEELRVSNEELEEQTRALKQSEKELQTQQEELRVINEELEEKTHSLEIQKKEITIKNNELGKAKEEVEIKASELEITSKYKSEFLANMSHELRTPLNSLLILSKNLMQNKKGNLTEDQLESVEIIRKSGDDLLNLINEILDLSKIESGKMSLHVENIKVEVLASNIRRNFGHVIEEKGLKLNVEVGENMPGYISTDIQRIEQVIKNLVSNAIKFTVQGTISVSFKPTPHEIQFFRSGLTHKNSFMLSVKDTGIGIPKEKQQIIFEAFQQADGSTSRNYGGTGLGLSITKEIAKLFGGEIHLESQPGSGSTFKVFLPVNYADSASLESVNPKEAPKPIIQSVVKPVVDEKLVQLADLQSAKVGDDRNNFLPGDRTILIVEDDENFARILKKQCHEKGFKFLYAASGEAGLMMAEKYLPNAMILDIKLPGIDGITVLDRIKENPKIRHIPVHMMSALEETIDVFQKGAIGYLTKPISPEKLDDAFTKMEDFINHKVKDLLIIEDDNTMRQQIIDVIGREEVNPTGVATGEEAIEMLRLMKFDCIVMDLGLPDMTGFELLKKLENEHRQNLPPVIIYTGKELTLEENAELKKHTDSIIIKGVKSEERLLDETALFLHRVVDNLPKDKQQIISSLHDKDAIFRGKKVLIVDDDMRNLFALSKVLDDKGMIVREAENGKVALEKLEKESDIDIVLMDIMMPVMDGYETMRQVRLKKEFKNLPIIALTAKAMKDDHERCIKAGANDYLTKPLDIDKLVSLMNVWLYR